MLIGAVICAVMPRPDVAFGVPHDKRFPPGATDINYNIMRAAFGGWWRADFSISEGDFVSYAREKDWKLESVTEPKDFQTGLAQGQFNVKTVSDGLSYSSPIAGNGGQTTAVYDRATGRGTIRSNSN